MRGLAPLLFAAFAACLLVACSHEAAPSAVPAASASEGAAAPPRQPDGVSLDLSAARVDAHSTAPARGGVALYPPPAREDVLAIVRAYFHAFGGGNERDFVSVLMPDARRLDEGGRTDLGSSLERRLRSFDYAHAPIESMVHYDDARMTTYDAAPPALAPTCAQYDHWARLHHRRVRVDRVSSLANSIHGAAGGQLRPVTVRDCMSRSGHCGYSR